MCFRSAGNWSVLAVVYSPCFWAFGSFYEFKLLNMRLEDPRVELISVSITWTLEISPVEAQCCPADSVWQHLRFAHLSSVFNLSWIAIKLEPVYKYIPFHITGKVSDLTQSISQQKCVLLCHFVARFAWSCSLNGSTAHVVDGHQK